MNKMFLLFSHNLTDAQKEDAKENFTTKEFVALPQELQELWSNVPSQLGEVAEYLEPLKSYLKEQLTTNDVVLVQGDFGATYHMVKFLEGLKVKAVHATTKRNVVEKTIEGKIVKTSIFEHVRFRIYG